MSFDGGSLNWTYSNHVFIILFTLGILLYDIHFPESHFLRMEIKVFLIIIDRIQKSLLCYHSVKLTFWIAEKHLNKLFVIDSIWFVSVIKVEQYLWLFFKRSLHHDIDWGKEFIKSYVPKLTFIEDSEHLITPKTVQMEERVKMFPYYTRFRGSHSDVLEHELQLLQLIRSVSIKLTLLSTWPSSGGSSTTHLILNL